METIIVHGGQTRLEGEVKIEGAKNAVLPLLAATILPTKGKTTLNNVPILSDVFTMNQVISGLAIGLEFDQAKNQIRVDARGDILDEAPYDYVSKMRASLVVLGPILARKGHAKVSMPGGCVIGSRPIDLHLKGLEALGATISQEEGNITASAKELIGATIYMDFPSVGATQNLMMAASLAKGTTIIENAAREPEIVDLALLLSKMGANIQGAGTETITIKGVSELQGCEHTVMQDRIEAGTFMVAAAMTSGNVLIQGAVWEHNRPLLAKLMEMGVIATKEAAGIRIQADSKALKPVTIKTLPHPGFPTDMQAQFSALMALVSGESTIIETVFENRFQHLEEMRRMGLSYSILRETALVHGGDSLQGAKVMSTDLRASAALILLGMVAKGQTVIGQLDHLDRGYYQFHTKLAKLGASIYRKKGV